MLFLTACAAFAAILICFELTVIWSRRSPTLFAGDWLAMFVGIVFTGAIAGSFGAMVASAIVLAANVFAGLVVATVTALVLLVAVRLSHRALFRLLPGREIVPPAA